MYCYQKKHVFSRILLFLFLEMQQVFHPTRTARCRWLYIIFKSRAEMNTVVHKQMQRSLLGRCGRCLSSRSRPKTGDWCCSLGLLMRYGWMLEPRPQQHNPSACIPQAVICCPSSLLKTSDGKIVRQLLTSIKKQQQKKTKHAAPYISSLVTCC